MRRYSSSPPSQCNSLKLPLSCRVAMREIRLASPVSRKVGILTPSAAEAPATLPRVALRDPQSKWGPGCPLGGQKPVRLATFRLAVPREACECPPGETRAAHRRRHRGRCAPGSALLRLRALRRRAGAHRDRRVLAAVAAPLARLSRGAPVRPAALDDDRRAHPPRRRSGGGGAAPLVHLRAPLRLVPSSDREARAGTRGSLVGRARPRALASSYPGQHDRRFRGGLPRAPSPRAPARARGPGDPGRGADRRRRAGALRRLDLSAAPRRLALAALPKSASHARLSRARSRAGARLALAQLPGHRRRARAHPLDRPRPPPAGGGRAALVRPGSLARLRAGLFSARGLLRRHAGAGRALALG